MLNGSDEVGHVWRLKAFEGVLVTLAGFPAPIWLLDNFTVRVPSKKPLWEGRNAPLTSGLSCINLTVAYLHCGIKLSGTCTRAIALNGWTLLSTV